MSQVNQTSADIAFIKDVVERRQKPDHSPAALGPMWGAITLAGCVFIDVRPQWSFLYWLTAPAIGFVISGVAGRRQAIAAGEHDAALRRRIGLHWSTCFIGMVPLMYLAVTGKIQGSVVGQMFLLMCGIVNFLAGVHLDRRWMLPGLVMIVGSAVVSAVPHWGWTTFGVLIFTSILISFRRRSVKEE